MCFFIAVVSQLSTLLLDVIILKRVMGDRL